MNEWMTELMNNTDVIWVWLYYWCDPLWFISVLSLKIIFLSSKPQRNPVNKNLISATSELNWFRLRYNYHVKKTDVRMTEVNAISSKCPRLKTLKNLETDSVLTGFESPTSRHHSPASQPLDHHPALPLPRPRSSARQVVCNDDYE